MSAPLFFGDTPVCQGKNPLTVPSNLRYRVPHMQDEISVARLRKDIGKKVEVYAFGVVYAGVLKSVDARHSLIRIEDEVDYVVLEIERIENFHVADSR